MEAGGKSAATGASIRITLKCIRDLCTERPNALAVSDQPKLRVRPSWTVELDSARLSLSLIGGSFSWTYGRHIAY
jgi:hypothetical protein